MIIKVRKITKQEPKKDIITIIVMKDLDNIREIIKMITEIIKKEIIRDKILQENTDKIKIKTEIETVLLKEIETGKKDQMLSMLKKEQNLNNNKINHLLVDKNKIITETINLKVVIQQRNKNNK